MYEMMMPFALLDQHSGQLILNTLFLSFVLLGIQLHTCICSLPFDMKLLRRPGWSHPYAAVSRCAFICSKWVTLAAILLHCELVPPDATGEAPDSPCRPFLPSRDGPL